jgi:hypothetical protein
LPRIVPTETLRFKPQVVPAQQVTRILNVDINLLMIASINPQAELHIATHTVTGNTNPGDFANRSKDEAYSIAKRVVRLPTAAALLSWTPISRDAPTSLSRATWVLILSTHEIVSQGEKGSLTILRGAAKRQNRLVTRRTSVEDDGARGNHCLIVRRQSR